MIIREGMVGFAGGKTFIQRAIRFFIGSDFSHSFIIVEGPDSAQAALETTETVVTVTPMVRKLSEKNWVELWEIKAPLYDKLDAADKTYR